MAYFKYIPYLFLIVAVLFIIEGIARYNEGRDFWPHLLLSLAAVAMFFIRKKMYRQRFGNPKK